MIFITHILNVRNVDLNMKNIPIQNTITVNSVVGFVVKIADLFVIVVMKYIVLDVQITMKLVAKFYVAIVPGFVSMIMNIIVNA
jgi:hypothetical protein